MAGLPSDYKVNEPSPSIRQKSNSRERKRDGTRKGRRKKNKEREKSQLVSSTTKKLNEIEQLLQDIDFRVETKQKRNSQKINDFATVMIILYLNVDHFYQQINLRIKTHDYYIELL